MTRGAGALAAPLLVVVALVVLTGCAEADDLADGAADAPTPEGTDEGAGADAAADGDVLRVYTSVTEDTVAAVAEAFEDAHDVELDVFRAPTGELNARIAAERRDDGLTADVLWLTDPLSMQPFADDGLLRAWTPEAVDDVPDAYAAETFWGTRLLNLVIVARDDLDAPPSGWWDLTDLDDVAFPDPGFAGSAFGALGHFALDEGFGMDYYAALDLTQVQAPGDVVTDVAEGRFSAGMTLDRTAREAVEDGSPVELVWPEEGAIAVDSPIAVVDGAGADAEALVEFVLSREAQELIAATGWQPVHPEADWPHDTGATVAPDWAAAAERRDELLEEYRALVGD